MGADNEDGTKDEAEDGEEDEVEDEGADEMVAVLHYIEA